MLSNIILSRVHWLRVGTLNHEVHCLNLTLATCFINGIANGDNSNLANRVIAKKGIIHSAL